MALDVRLLAWVEEAMAPLGTVTKRAMMGGATLYLDGTIFAIVSHDGLLWFKGDAESDATWDAAGCPRFSYTMGEGREGSMNYRRAPDDCYDHADAFREWAALGVAAGQRAPVKKAKAKSKK